ncbi:MAG: hypothetical protein A4E53_02547 [Pelotomaculum sp. PtaB.Bin104]|nr:MAG: hypothetical protein A4E53_02547 [Pelotomaculum sp. PtaB.Bin104]OPY61731.1 MAG: hypothetical protein A4E56_01850 [Pelotomaculum sp. PtaU1.Bin065]
MKKKENTGSKKVCESSWRVVVEAAGTPGQREQAIKQATRYVLSRITSRKKTPRSGNLSC